MTSNIYKLTLNQIDKIEPSLKKYYGYTGDILLLDIYETYFREIVDKDLRERVEKHKAEMVENCCDESNGVPKSVQELVREKNLFLFLNFEKYCFTELKEKCILPENENNETIYCLLYFITYLSYRDRYPCKSRPENVLDMIDTSRLLYEEKIRPDMLKLFLFQDAISDKFKSKRKSVSITLKCGKSKIEISNEENWFIEHLFLYLDEYLAVESVKEALNELDLYKGKQGRTCLSPLINRIIWGTYNLLMELSAFSSCEKKVSDKVCSFIINFLIYLRLINEEHILYDNILQIRATINYQIKNGYNPYPWDSKLSPKRKLPDNLKDYITYW